MGIEYKFINFIKNIYKNSIDNIIFNQKKNTFFHSETSNCNLLSILLLYIMLEVLAKETRQERYTKVKIEHFFSAFHITVYVKNPKEPTKMIFLTHS